MTRKRLFTLLFMFLVCNAAQADTHSESWQILSERDGVTLSQPREPGGFAVPSRGETVLEAPLFEVLAVIQDVPRHVDWRPRCVESRTVLQPGGAPLIYSRSAGSWPVADRDSIVRSELSSQRWGHDARVGFDSVESSLAPPVDGVVRTPFVAGHYALEALGPERTRVAYQIGIDMGGLVPGFVTRFVSEDMPIDTLVNLRSQVRRTRGEYHELVATWEDLDTLPESRTSPAPQ